jgi:Ca2+-binding EF-hand superfamily protein
MKLPDDYDVYGPPKKKQNNWIQETEKLDQIPYFFDYIDDIFQKEISKEFKELIEEAKRIPEEDQKIFDDPYSADKLLFYWSHGQEGRDPIKGKADTAPVDLLKLKQFNPEFDLELWKESFSAAKISNIIKTFGWSSIRPIPYFFKRLIDKYDFNGNGRLDHKEFLFFAIWENYKNYSTCQKHCFKNLIETIINPLFTFFDCDQDGYINSENLWEGMRYLKRSAPEKYNFYKCEVPKPYNKYYRTHAPNDFVLKNYEVADGYLNKEEFIKGILLGYWERQTKPMLVVDDDSINKKSERWDTSALKDLDCEELLLMYDRKN